MSKHKGVYDTPSYTKKVFANMKIPSKGFSERVTPLFSTMMVQAIEDMEPTTEETTPEEHVSTLPMIYLQEITSLKKRVKQLEKRSKSRTSGLRRLRKVGFSSRVESSNDASLGAQEDASKQERKIKDLDADAEVTLVTKTQERNDEEMLFDVHDDLQGEEVVAKEVIAEKEVSTVDPVTTAGEGVTTANVEVTTVSAPTITIDELTLAQTLIEIKAAKPKAVTTTATTITSASTRPKAKGIVLHDQEEQTHISTKTFSSYQASQHPQAKDKVKEIMIEPERPLKKKDQVALDEEMARNLEAQLQAELIEEERLARQNEEEAKIGLIESWDNTQAIIEADFELAQRLQAEKQGKITIEERSRLFIELMNRRKKHFAKLRAEEEKRKKPPTKAQKRNLMSTYLKNMDSEVMKSNERTEESSKRTEDKLEPDKSKKAESSKKKAKGSRKKSIGKKRARKEQKQESSKRQRIKDDKETDKHEEAE
ncbi:hypothetical protein Tco_1389558, partial [Tanacetum coccineum]